MTYSIFHSTRAIQTFLEAVIAIVLLIAWLRPRLGKRFFAQAEGHFARLAKKRRLAIAFAALFPMVLRILLLPVYPIPEPRVHDEFSYLLLGDTLAHGRLANPTPPLWQHFETEYELVRPTYASQYEPGQGVVLAAGEAIAGNAWWGVWLSVGLMCGSLCWALGFAIPLRWALFASLLAGLQFGVFGFWMNSFFGGAVPALGGALIFGALLRRAVASSGVIAAAGLLIVLASRPAEGIIWLFAAIAVLIVRRTSKRVVLSFVVCLAMGLAALGYYNARITGNALESPYTAYRHDYGTPQSYWWQPPVLVNHFDNPELAANYEDQLRYWQRRYSAVAMWDATWHRLRDFWRFFVGPFLTPALLFGLLAIRRKRLRIWWCISAVFILDHATYHAWYPQQSAPETVLILLLLAEGWRYMRAWRPRWRVGLVLSRQLTAGFAAACLLLCAGLVALPAIPARWAGFRRVWEDMSTAPDARTIAIRRLNSMPGRHLVFVKYRLGHPWYDEWVFNGADIPGSRIVFARMCSPESDQALAQSMADRDVWIASPDEQTVLARVTPKQLLLASTYGARQGSQSE